MQAMEPSCVLSRTAFQASIHTTLESDHGSSGEELDCQTGAACPWDRLHLARCQLNYEPNTGTRIGSFPVLHRRQPAFRELKLLIPLAELR